MTSAIFSVSIIDDNTLEKNEDFFVYINESSLPNTITVSHPNHARVIIVDDDSK